MPQFYLLRLINVRNEYLTYSEYWCGIWCVRAFNKRAMIKKNIDEKRLLFCQREHSNNSEWSKREKSVLGAKRAVKKISPHRVKNKRRTRGNVNFAVAVKTFILFMPFDLFFLHPAALYIYRAKTSARFGGNARNSVITLSNSSVCTTSSSTQTDSTDFILQKHRRRKNSLSLIPFDLLLPYIFRAQRERERIYSIVALSAQETIYTLYTTSDTYYLFFVPLCAVLFGHRLAVKKHLKCNLMEFN